VVLILFSMTAIPVSKLFSDAQHRAEGRETALLNKMMDNNPTAAGKIANE
jgi:hypothetical protein